MIMISAGGLRNKFSLWKTIQIIPKHNVFDSLGILQVEILLLALNVPLSITKRDIHWLGHVLA